MRSDLRHAEMGTAEERKALSLPEDNVVGFTSAMFTYAFQTSQGM